MGILFFCRAMAGGEQRRDLDCMSPSRRDELAPKLKMPPLVTE
jgi:hypothetical protein